MSALERKPQILDYVETFIFQSDKCFAVFPPLKSAYAIRLRYH